MKALSSAVSFTLHVAVGAAALLGTTTTVRSNPARPDTTVFVMAPETRANHGDGIGGPSLPGPIDVAPPDFKSIGAPSIPDDLVPTPLFATGFFPRAGSANGQTNGWSPGTEERAEVLAGPLPVYPELLRQAGVQGKVVLEAIVDTTGRVLAPSILVVLATNPGFIAPARAALLATLFRPAMVASQPVPIRVRIPYEFAIRNGAGHAR